MREQTALPPDVLLEVHKRTQGIPRLINLVSDNLLLTAFAMERRQATIQMLDEVTRDMELEWPGSGRRFADVETAPVQAV
jgi:hypothetical protein